MLETLGEKEAGKNILAAIEKALESGVKTIDLGGNAKTTEITNSILSFL